MAAQFRWTSLRLRPTESPASWISSRPELRRQLLADLTDQELSALEYDWDFWARRAQLAPEGDWRNWLVLAGRGFGKTRCGVEQVRHWAESGRYPRIAIVAPTTADIRKVIVGGESGFLKVCPPWNRPRWLESKGELIWPNGSVAYCFTAEEPERLRGPQHYKAWCDELVAYKYPQALWDMLMFGLRLGDDPQTVITTTPKPMPLLKKLLADKGTKVTRGSTYDNQGNLAPAFLAEIVKAYEGTRLGRQELLAELLDDTPGALWTRALIDAAQCEGHPDLWRIVIAVDPAVTANPDSDETGIIAAGAGVDDRGYALGDYSCQASPSQWAQRAVNAFWAHGADCIVAESNQGGDMVASTIAAVDRRVPVKLVRATRGKFVRAEPIAALYEQGRFRHIRTAGLETLEDQLVSWSPQSMAESPDRLDALVWAGTELFFGTPDEAVVTHEERVVISEY